MPQETTPNVDPSEIQKFSDLAHRWWDPDGEFRPLHLINPLRLSWIDSHAHLKGKKILDVGCGGGILSDAMARLGGDVLGIDMSAKVLQAAQLHALEAQTPPIQYKQISVENLAVEHPSSFDVITCMEMLEHVPDPNSIINAITTLVKPGGYVFFATINKNIKSFTLAIVGAEYIMKLIPPGTHEYARLIRPANLAYMARNSGLNLQAQIGLHYNPLTHTSKLTPNTSVNYMQAYQRPI